MTLKTFKLNIDNLHFLYIMLDKLSIHVKRLACVT